MPGLLPENFLIRASSAYHAGLPAVLCAEHVRQPGGASPLHNLMEVKC
jgi:hypothetical protein